MPFRLTYAFKSTDEVFSVQLVSMGVELLDAYNVAVCYIEEEHGTGKSKELKGFSLLMLDEPKNN